MKYCTLLLLFTTMCLGKVEADNITFAQTESDPVKMRLSSNTNQQTYILKPGDVLTFPDKIDVTKCGYVKEYFEQNGNAHQLVFKGIEGRYSIMAFDANPYLYGVKKWSFGTKYVNYGDWSNDDKNANGVTYYNSHRFYTPSDKGDSYSNCEGYYLLVFPASDASSRSDTDEFSWLKDHTSYLDKTRDASYGYFGYGDIWIIGNSSFGFPRVKSWNGDWCFKSGITTGGWAGDNFVAMPQTEKNLHVITIKTGQNLVTESGTTVCFGFQLAQNWWNSDDGRESNGHSGAFGKGSGDYGVELKSTDLDYLQVNSSGNIVDATKPNDDSRIPYLPLNYDLKVTVDLRNVSSWSNVPLTIGLTNRPVLDENDTKKEGVDEYTSMTVYLSGSMIPNRKTGEVNVQWADDDVNSYTITDALRFQGGVLYEKQKTAKFDKLKIVGVLNALNDKDVSYLQTLVKNGQVKNLDLSEALMPGLVIPADFAKGATGLEGVVLPKILNKIESSAFEGCTSLTNVTFTGADIASYTIESAAFKGCTSLTSASVTEIMKTTPEVKANVFKDCTQLQEVTIPNNIKKLNDNAFSGCNNIKKITVPSRYMKPAPIDEANENRVGTAYPNAHALPVEKDKDITIEAEDFNSGTAGLAYFFAHNGNQSAYEKYRDDAVGAPIWNVSGNSHNNPTANKPLVIGDFAAGDFMNYTVTVEKGGTYSILFNVGNGDTGNDAKFTIYVDGESQGQFTAAKGGNYNACSVQLGVTDDKAVLMPKGSHVIKFYADTKINVDYMTVKRVDTNEDYDTDEEKKPIEDPDLIVPELSASAFSLTPNLVEIAFTGEDSENHYQDYRANANWKALITKTLTEEYGNSVTDIDWVHQAHADVNFDTRSLNAGWNTIVLPFNMNATQLAASSLKDERLLEYKSVVGKDGQEVLNFWKVLTTTAGVPYMLKMANANTQPKFVDVELLTKAQAPISDPNIGNYKFVGTYNYVANAAESANILYIKKGTNQFWFREKGNGSTSMKGFRGWFEVKDEAKAKLMAMGAIAFTEDDSATGISIVNATPSSDVYNINGQLVRQNATGLEGLGRGVYIINGKKVVK